MTAAEEALRKYGVPLLVREYDQVLSPAQQSTLLEALVTGSRQALFQLSMQHKQNCNAEQERAKKKAKPSCPLVRALGELGVHIDALAEEDLAYLRQRLATWGSPAGNQFPFQQLLRYQQVVRIQKSSPSYTQNNNKEFDILQTNQAVAKTNRSLDPEKWDPLRPITIRDLNLFAVNHNCYLEGKIVGEVIQPMVGGTTMIQDKNGDFLLICFYNLLPDGIRGSEAEPLLQQKLPMGSTLKVAEPFLKIFGDGQRGVRVDDPGEMRVVELAAKKSGSSNLGASNHHETLEEKCKTLKQQGNDFVAQKRYYAAAELYLSGARCNELVPTLLSNRSQAFINRERYEEAFCDAAAALTMSNPQSRITKKAWRRYELCLEKLKERISDDSSTRRNLFLSFIDSVQPPLMEPLDKSVNTSKGESFKKQANESFQKKDYEQAIQLYSQGLQACGCTVRALLSNWSLCALETMALGDAIAASIASLRIALDEKAIYRLCKALSFLGEYDAVHRVAASVPGMPFVSLVNEVDKAQRMQSIFVRNEAESSQDIHMLVYDTPSLLGNWVGPVETFMSKGKGRGLRATHALSAGQVVCCEIPVVSSLVECKEGNLGSYVASFGKNNQVDDASQSQLQSVLALRLQHDGVLSQILSRLSDGKKYKPLVPLTDLLLNLELFPLLLPAHREFLRDKGAPRLSLETVKNIMSTNTHGIHEKDNFITGTTDLLPGISMMNHASQPNCSIVPTKTRKHATSAVVVATIRPIQEGEELTMKYNTDEVVARKWGISG